MKIKVYSGLTVENKCGKQVHPITEVNRAIDLINNAKELVFEEFSPYRVYSNSPDFISAIKYLAEQEKIDIMFNLDGVDLGTDIEPIFNSFNKSFELLENK